MQLNQLCLELINYINCRLNSDDITKHESNSLKLVKGVICDYVIADLQRRKERNVTD